MGEFERFVERATEVANDAAADERAIDLYRTRLPSRRVVGAGAAILFGVFVCGVAIPMIRPGVSTVIDAWIPATVYGLFLAFAAIQALRHYSR